VNHDNAPSLVDGAFVFGVVRNGRVGSDGSYGFATEWYGESDGNCTVLLRLAWQCCRL